LHGAPGFFLMSHRKNRCSVSSEVIESYITTISEIDQPFPKRRIHICNRATGFRLERQYFHASPYRLDCPSSRIFIFQGEETIKSLNVSESWRRPYQT